MVACLIVLATMVKRPFRWCAGSSACAATASAEVILLPVLTFATLIGLAIMESRWHAEVRRVRKGRTD